MVDIVEPAANEEIVITAADLTGAVTEDAANPALADSGVIAYSDPDISDVHGATTAFFGTTHTSQLGSLTASITDAATGDGAGEVTWNFTVDNAAVQFLGAGDVITETYTLTLADNEGAVVNQDINVTISGLGEIVSDPIIDLIAPGSITVELVEFAQIPFTLGGFARNYINFTYHAPDDSGRLYVAESKGGRIWIVEPDGTVDSTPFLDMRAFVGQSLIDSNSSSGLRTFAFHPDYFVEGAAGQGKIYVMATMTPESAQAGVEIFDGPFEAFSHSTLMEWTVDPLNPDRIDPTSARELFRITEPVRTHNSEQIMFDPNAQPGDADYGMMYITTSDGQASPAPDPNQHAQDLSDPRGKILRIDPLQQENGDAFAAAADNPFVDDADALDLVWASGLRHPENLVFDTGGDGEIIFTDIGQFSVEEVNLGLKGANYGWPLREGYYAQSPDGATHPTTGKIFDLPVNDAALYDFVYPVAQYDHDEGFDVGGKAAIVGGYVYRDNDVPDLNGVYLFGDIVSGRVFYVNEADLELGQEATPQELILTVNGVPTTLLEIVGAEQGATRVDLRFGQNSDGEVFITTKQNGKIYKLLPAGSVDTTPGPGIETGLERGLPSAGDFDGDGAADILLRLNAFDRLIIKDQDGFVATLGLSNHTVVTARDLDGDGADDVLVRTIGAEPDAGKMFAVDGDGAFLAGYGDRSGDTLLDVEDFDGDGGADLLFRSGSTGNMFIVDGNGGFQNGIGRADWNFLHAADLDGDGAADIVLTESGTDKNLGVVIAVDGLGQLITGYGNRTGNTIIGFEDFDGDGGADLLFRDDLTGNHYSVNGDGGFLAGYGQSGREIAAIADLNGDGAADILFREPVGAPNEGIMFAIDGSTGAFLMAYGDRTSQQFLGIGDFDGNGTEDLLFQNETSGNFYAISGTGGLLIGYGRDGRELVTIADFNGDGADDLLLRNLDDIANPGAIFAVDGLTGIFITAFGSSDNDILNFA